MAIGIAAEFNPFHNGHKYLIEEAKRISGENAVVAVMSGEWVQRGEPAITDKWTRAHTALENGVDLVLELPVTCSLNTAQKFAYGAVRILAATGAVEKIAFGSECGNVETLVNAADCLINEPPAVSAKIKKLNAEGISFAAARCAAYEGIIPKEILTSPNDILAVEYIRSSKEIGADLTAFAIKRLGAAHDGKPGEGIASASHIRKLLSDRGTAAEYMPDTDFPIYNKSALDAAVIARLRSCGADYLRNINDVSEGLENRFIKGAAEASTVDALCMSVKSKRYALSRIRRIAYSALLGITKDAAAIPPSYIRVLGMTRRGMAILKKMKSTAALPVITKAADYHGDKIFNINSRAEDIFALCAPSSALSRGGRDIRQSPLILY